MSGNAVGAAQEHRQGGFTFIGLLIAIVVLGIALSTVGVVWSTQTRRDREAQLLFVGDQYRQAIGRYLMAGGVYPQSLQDLVTDTRMPNPRRYLRKLYRDPVTGQLDWELIRGTDGGIMGVASRSKQKPIKLARFPLADQAFENATCYCGWRFIYTSKSGPGRRRVLPSLPTNPSR